MIESRRKLAKPLGRWAMSRFFPSRKAQAGRQAGESGPVLFCSAGRIGTEQQPAALSRRARRSARRSSIGGAPPATPPPTWPSVLYLQPAAELRRVNDAGDVGPARH